MDARVARGLRFVVGGSLLLGGGVLLAFARLWPELPEAALAAILAGLWSLALVALVLFVRRRRAPWPVSAGALILSMVLGVAWARLDPGGPGHLVLSGLTPVVALLTGAGVLYREAWSWPVALSSVTGFGPIVLLIAPLGTPIVLGGFALFLVDAGILLALHGHFFPKPEGA